MAVLMLDLDHFKVINDTYGHIVGDHVLRAVAQELAAETRDYDTAGRFGGEEFIVLLPEVDAENVRGLRAYPSPHPWLDHPRDDGGRRDGHDQRPDSFHRRRHVPQRGDQHP